MKLRHQRIPWWLFYKNMEDIIYENEDKMLVYNKETKDLVWIDDDIVTHIEPTENLMERMRIVSYFGEILPLEAFSFVVDKVKNKI